MGDINPAVIEHMWKALVEFGYEDLTLADAQEATNKAVAHEEDGDVIAMFIARWLDEAGLRPQEPTNPPANPSGQEP